MDYEAIDQLLSDPKFSPFRGWHGDYPEGADYFPAIQQDRAEFLSFLEGAKDHLRRSLILGLGLAGGMHAVFSLFGHSTAIDGDEPSVSRYLKGFPGSDILYGDFNDDEILEAARTKGPYSLLFIDGTHAYDHVKADYERYSPLVRAGGIVAFHDSSERYPQVLEFLNELKVNGAPLALIEPFSLGIAWMQLA